MAPKSHGTSAAPVQRKLRFGCNTKTADRICNFNRHYAEPPGVRQHDLDAVLRACTLYSYVLHVLTQYCILCRQDTLRKHGS